jgi:hypothetical protein
MAFGFVWILAVAAGFAADMVLAGEATRAQAAQGAQGGFDARDFLLDGLKTAVRVHV